MTIQEALESKEFKNLPPMEKHKFRFTLWDKISQSEKFQSLPDPEKAKFRMTLLAPTAEVKEPWVSPTDIIPGAAAGGMIGKTIPAAVTGAASWLGTGAIGDVLYGAGEDIKEPYRTLIPAIISTLIPGAAAKYGRAGKTLAQMQPEKTAILEAEKIPTRILPGEPVTVTSPTGTVSAMTGERMTAEGIPTEIPSTSIKELSLDEIKTIKEMTKGRRSIEDLMARFPEEIKLAPHEPQFNLIGKPYTKIFTGVPKKVSRETTPLDVNTSWSIDDLNIPFAKERLKAALETPGFRRTAEQKALLDTFEYRSQLNIKDRHTLFSDPTPPPEPEAQQIILLHAGIPIPNTEKIKRISRAVWETVGSPYELLGKTAPGKKLWQATYEGDKAKGKFLAQLHDGVNQNIKIRLDSESSFKIGKLLDTYEDLSNVPQEALKNLSKDELQAFKFFRDKWNDMGDVLVENGVMPAGRRLKSYFFRVFDKETVYSAWKNERDLINIKLGAGKGGQTDAANLAKIEKSIKEYEKTGNILWDYVPRELTAPFLKQRKGAPGYSWDSVKAFNIYSYYYARKVYDEPAVKQAFSFMKDLPYKDQQYARWYLRDFLGMNKQTALDDLSKTITGLEYISKLGFNPRSAIVNSTQNLNTIVEIGPVWTARGATKAFTEEGHKLWLESGHATDIPGIYTPISEVSPIHRYGQIAKGMGKLNNVAMYLFNKIEEANRKVAYLGAYGKALSEGKAIPQAIEFADDTVKKTQFLYGRVGMPKFMRSPVGRVVGQFMTFPIKQTELMINWGKENPKKLISYLLLAEGAREGLYQGLGIDISNALGIGLNFKETFKSLHSLGTGDTAKAEFHARQIFKPGAGIFPSFAPPALSDVSNLLDGDYHEILPVEAQRLAEGWKAISEGKITTPFGESGYPVRSLGKGGELKYVMTPGELITKTFLAKTRKETESQKFTTEETMAVKMRSKAKQQAVDYLVEGKQDKAIKLAREYDFDITDKDMENEWKRRNLTTAERRKLILQTHPAFQRTLRRLQEGRNER